MLCHLGQLLPFTVMDCIILKVRWMDRGHLANVLCRCKLENRKMLHVVNVCRVLRLLFQNK